MSKQFVELNTQIKVMNEASSKAFSLQESVKDSYQK